jgi:hypothetical protein
MLRGTGSSDLENKPNNKHVLNLIKNEPMNLFDYSNTNVIMPEPFTIDPNQRMGRHN